MKAMQTHYANKRESFQDFRMKYSGNEIFIKARKKYKEVKVHK